MIDATRIFPSNNELKKDIKIDRKAMLCLEMYRNLLNLFITTTTKKKIPFHILCYILYTLAEKENRSISLSWLFFFLRFWYVHGVQTISIIHGGKSYLLRWNLWYVTNFNEQNQINLRSYYFMCTYAIMCDFFFLFKYFHTFFLFDCYLY